MPSVFPKPDRVLSLAGFALADLALLLSAQQYVPTLHLAKTSFWSGKKINQIRFGSYPNTGLIELARAEATAREGTWDTWAFACVAVSPIDREHLVLLVEAGDAPVANDVRIIQEFRPPKEGFALRGIPRFSLTIQGQTLPLDETETPRWLNFLHQGIKGMKPAHDKWEQWSLSPPD